MSDNTQDQVNQWLKKLERESWQLELLVSAFTIFLLIGAGENLGELLEEMSYTYSFNGPLGLLVFFLGLLYTSIKVLTAFLIIHLLLRGFWIGAIGLRSVQPSIEYEKLNYSAFFLEKLKKRVIGLDRLVVILDELCSVLFSLSFLIIFMIISFGLYFLFVGITALLLGGLADLLGGGQESVVFIPLLIIFLFLIVSGIIYLIDYFTLGFFKKWNRFGKIYYPIYKFYGAITLSFISRSIYYNLISKYSKKKIRIMYLIMALLIFSDGFVNFDQYQYFPEGDVLPVLETNYYDDTRSDEEYIEKVSVPSKYVNGDFISLFLRYDPKDNKRIESNCPDFQPLKNDGFNASLQFKFTDNGLTISPQKFEDEDKEMLLGCLKELYVISVNDSVYADLKFFFYEHPMKSQKGILTVIPTKPFRFGDNVLKIKKTYVSDSVEKVDDFATLPLWYSGD